VRQLVGAHRLVTLTGFCGIGKSRLAEGVLAGWEAPPWDRLVRVRCDPDAPAHPAAALALACGAPADAPHDPAALAALWAGERTLVFLDDVDPVQAECTRLVQQLLMADPAVRVLVTARRPLGLGEEQVMPVTALPVEGPATQLFMERAGDNAPGPELVAEVCRLVEGVPLAVELAADQLDHHGIDELLARLRQGQGWLTSSYPGLRRHRSLADAIGDGYRLCDRDLRITWARASVFTGSFTESGAVAVTSGGGIDAGLVPSCLARLTSLGVLRVSHDPGGVRRPRYRMTRAAREFGAARLAAAGEYPVAAARRIQHVQQLAAQAGRHWDSGDQLGALRLVRDELTDLLASVRHALEHPHPEHTDAALDSVVSVWFWWLTHGHAALGLDLLSRLLPLCEPGRPSAVGGTWLAAWLAADSEPATARAHLAALWPTAVLEGDDVTLGRIAHVEGLLALRQGDTRAAAAHFESAAELVPVRVPGGPSPAVSLAALAVAHAEQAPRAALRAARRAVSCPGVRDDAWAGAVANYAWARVDAARGLTARAWHRAHRALAATAGSGPCHTALTLLLTDLGSTAPLPGGTYPLFLPASRTTPRPTVRPPEQPRRAHIEPAPTPTPAPTPSTPTPDKQP
jgi:predicted ATPase